MGEKKSIAVITRHNVPNYGSILQAYATEKVLKGLGYSPFIVDYRRSQEEIWALANRYSEGKSFINKVYHHTLWIITQSVVESRFRLERRKLISLSRKCNEKDFWQSFAEPDIYLTGSDQVWNDLGDGSVDGAFFWNGIEKKTGQRIISYAASFGGSGLPSGHEADIAKWIKKFDAISVREDSGVSLVEQCGKKAVQVLDPTFLLTKDEWASLAIGAKVPRKPYVLVYNLHPDSNMLDYVERETRDSGLNIVSICPSFRRRIGKQVVLPTIAEFIALFENAACVYTDSFHGTSFCINLETPFVAVFPKENSARNHSVLRLFGLEQRAWDVFEGDAWDNDIDWNYVHERLSLEREQSITWLKAALEGGCL